MESLKIYRITEKYVRFLNTVDSRVQYNKGAPSIRWYRTDC